MLPSRGARCSRNAVHTTKVQLNGAARNVRLYSITTRALPRRPNSLSNRDISSTTQARSFSSTPLQQWSWALWKGPNAESATTAPSSSEFATSSSNEFAQYQGLRSTPTQVSRAPISEATQAPPEIAPASSVSPVAESSLPPVQPHHGTPLTGPEHLLPDPITHLPYLNSSHMIDDVGEIGYLKQLGLDYGWGTSTPMQYVLECLHVYGGLPWWASAMTAAVIVRLLFVSMQVKNSNATARWQRLRPLHEPLMEDLKAARLEGDQFKMADVQKRMGALKKEADFKLGPMFIPVLGQAVLGFGLWRNLRGIAELPLPALENEKFLWLEDLSTRGSYFPGLAFLQAGTMYMTMRLNARTTATNAQQTFIQGMLRRAFPVLSFFIVAFQPAIVQIYFVTSSVLNLGVTYMINNRTFRERMKLEPLPDPKDVNPSSIAKNVPSTLSETLQKAGVNAVAPSRRPSSSATTTPPSTAEVSILDRLLSKVNISNFSKSAEEAQVKKSKSQVRKELEDKRLKQHETTRFAELERERTRRNEQARRAFEREREREREQKAYEEMMAKAQEDIEEEIDERAAREAVEKKRRNGRK